jgi:dTDP-glucose 4,6-dehydratase
MRVLLTGAGGFVGHHTLEHLLKTTDWEVVVTDSFRHKGYSSRLRAVFEANPDKVGRVTVVTHDLRTPIDVVTAEQLGQFDVIINNASESHVDRSLIEPRHFIENNVAIATTMLDYARTQTDLKMFIQVSTDEVYGPAKNGSSHPEYDPILPSNPYSASKAAQEAIAIAYWRSYDVPVVLSNTMNIFGERQDVEKFIPKTISCFLKAEQMPVHGAVADGKFKSGSRFYLHARNQADALVHVAKHAHEHPIRFSEGVERPHRFHVGGEREVANDEMAIMIAEYMGINVHMWEPVQQVDVGTTRPGHDLRYALDRKTLEEWGWVPPVPFEASLRKVVAWTLNNQEWLLSSGD